MPAANWTPVSESRFAWEAEALEFLRDRLPPQEGFHGWSNLEFVAQDGSVNEVDALLLTPRGLLVVEVKSHAGQVSGELAQWTWTFADGGQLVMDNPLMLTNTKAKRLKGLLGATQALRGRRVPWVEAAVFLGNKEARSYLRGAAATRVFARGGLQPELAIGEYLKSLDRGDDGERLSVQELRTLRRALEELNLRRIQREFRVGQYQLAELIDDAEIYQDYVGKHRVDGHARRIRLYPWPATGPDTGRRARRRAAEREFGLLNRTDLHPGVLHAHGLEDTERGFALILEHPAKAERLDVFLARRGSSLDLRQRLRLVRAIAEVLAWAHGAGLFHRALTPHAVLVTDPDSDSPGIRVFNWQVGIVEEQVTSETQLSYHDFLQVGLGGRRENVVYLAPEVRMGAQMDPTLLDVFSLGGLAYLLITLAPAAASAEELLARLRETKGLRPVQAVDGVPEDLDAAVQLATSPDPGERPDVGYLLAEVDKVLGAVAAAADADGQHTHPLEAEQGTELQGGFTVQRRLGSGATAVALEVTRDEESGVLKVAREPGLNDRLRAEGDILRTLRHQHVVELYDVVEVSGHAALFIELAGQQTLAQRIRKEGALSLDLLQRFGEELLNVVDWLEQRGIPHRDLKPDNIGVGETRTRKLTLKLFDFSLSSAPADNIRSGTPGYLDPFLSERRPARWDAAAERYAATVTLHEMATGVLPQWGDGRQHPATLPPDVQPVIAVDRLDPMVRGGLARFFQRALQRNPAERFDTAEVMRKAWNDLFVAIDQPQTATGTETEAVDVAAAMALADADTPLATLGFTPRVLNAMERLGALTVGQLAELPPARRYAIQGIGMKTVREIRDAAEQAARAMSNRAGSVQVAGGTAGTAGGGTTSAPALFPLPMIDADGLARAEPSTMSVDLLQREFIGPRVAQPDQRVLRQLSGLDSPLDAEGGDLWPSQHDVADGLGLARAQLTEVAERARARWGKKPAMTVLRDDVSRMLADLGGVATVEELARALLLERGSSTSSDVERLKRSRAALWCALEMEAAREGTCRFRLQRGERLLVVVATGDGAAEQTNPPAAVRKWVEALGVRADRLVAADPLVPMGVALEELERIERPSWVLPCTPNRLLRLVASAAESVAITGRGELYRVGLEPEEALRLAAGSLVGVSALKVEQVEERVRARFPRMAPLPPRPQLDRLLQDSGVQMEWDEVSRQYVSRNLLSAPTGVTGTWSPTVVLPTAGVAIDPRAEVVARFEERMDGVVRAGRFLALVTPPQRLKDTAVALQQRYPLAPLSLEHVVLEALRAEVAAIKAQWPVVLAADAEAPGSRDRTNLANLVSRAKPRMVAALAAITGPTLLLNAGLLARYGLMELFAPLQDHARRGPAIVLLIPGNDQSALPTIDGTQLPVVQASDWARVPSDWVRRSVRVA